MGLPITRDNFSPQEFERFQAKVDADLAALDQLLRRDSFGTGPASIGAEIEYYIVDAHLNALPINQELLEQVKNPRLTVELNRFNLEYNLCPQALRGSPWLAMERDIGATLADLNRAAADHGGRIAAIGILPTLRHRDFNDRTMTDIPRYRALSRALRQQRGDAFRIDIDGADPLTMAMDDVTLEGASTSYQIHWRVPPREFADHFNAVQLVTPVVLALAANSPSLFGHMLWDETRIALFKQSIDTRLPLRMNWRHPARVSFGEGWVQEGAWELFAAAVALYPPVIPIVGDEDPLAVIRAGGVPNLDELRLHQGTTWPWNRAIYDFNAGGHLRIEMRALPCGPTPIDMSANALFLIGTALAVRKNIRHLTMVLPFRYAEQNFYRAAQQGVEARLIWPGGRMAELREIPILEVARTLLPRVPEALANTELASAEIERLLKVIEGRIEAGISPARWQRGMIARLKAESSREEAMRAMLSRYLTEQERGRPLHEWSLEP